MAAFQRILYLVVLSGFVLPGLSLSPSVAPIWSHPLPARVHSIDQKQSQDFTSPHSGKAEVDGLESYGETDNVMPDEQVDGGYRRLVEGAKGERWVKDKRGGNDAAVWGKPADASTEQGKYNGETGSWGENENRRWSDSKPSTWGQTAADDKEKRKWGENSMRVWGKRAGSGTEKRKWGDNSMSVWGKRVPSTETENRRWGDNSKRLEDGNEKRKWGDNSMNVWGKRSDSDRVTSDFISTRERNNKASGVDDKNQVVTHAPGWAEQKKADLAKGTGSTSESHRILNKRSILDHEKPRYAWLYEELSKKSRPRWDSHGNQYGGPKRNWETNTMKVWGKRGLALKTIPNWDDYLDEEAEGLDGKRSWTSDNALRIWGKRNHQLEANGVWRDLLDSYES